MMQMPKVIDCVVSDCAYNREEECHAMAITVGGPEPLCDTFMRASHKGGDEASTGCVGACKVESCVHNVLLECAAKGIHVTTRGAQPECATFNLG